ncbi:MAG: PEP-CTERM sorting domain-containing protein [Gemmataceae bacterium]
MKRLFLSALATIGLLFPAVCRAEPVPFNYSFSISPSQTIAGGTGSVTFSLFGGGALAPEAGETAPLLAASLFTTSSALADTPDVFSAPYALTVTVQDTGSMESHDFTFSGMLGGTLTATESHVTATFDGPLSAEYTLGGYLYTVSVEPETANLPPPGSLADVLLNANVMATAVQPDGGGGTGGGEDPTVTETPEPATLVLGLLAGPALLLARRRRRQAA